MKEALYRRLLDRIVAMRNCIDHNNKEWEEKHAEEIEKLLKLLPSGSGFDGKWNFDIDDCNEERLHLTGEYHPMNEAGYYEGWIEFSIIVLPNLLFDINVKILGRFGKHQDLKDYIITCTRESLMEEVE